MKNKNLSNKVIWITGASSGIGEALVSECAKHGAIIVLSARREEELKRVVREVNLSDKNSLIIAFDLADTTKANEYAQQIIKKFGRIDILINNAGRGQRTEVLETLPEVERNLFEVNYFAAVNLAKAVLPEMIKNGGGKIVVISSIAGKFGFYLRSTYSAAKHALHGYFETLRLELEKNGISVVLVCPGKIKANASRNAAWIEGKPYNKVDSSHSLSMEAQVCAQQIISGILLNKEEIFVGGKEISLPQIKRFLPKLFGKMIRKQSPYY